MFHNKHNSTKGTHKFFSDREFEQLDKSEVVASSERETAARQIGTVDVRFIGISWPYSDNFATKDTATENKNTSFKVLLGKQRAVKRSILREQTRSSLMYTIGKNARSLEKLRLKSTSGQHS